MKKVQSKLYPEHRVSHSDTCLELLREDITVERTEVENKSTSSAATGIVTRLSKSHLKSQDSTSEETV